MTRQIVAIVFAVLAKFGVIGERKLFLVVEIPNTKPKRSKVDRGNLEADGAYNLHSNNLQFQMDRLQKMVAEPWSSIPT